jgi:hypothetical protein
MPNSLGRMSLIIGTQCATMPELSFVTDLAHQLYSDLAAAGWGATPPGVSQPLLNPTDAELKDAVEKAFIAADAAQATLLLSYIGHGVARGERDFYLLATDAPAERPNAQRAFHFSEFIRQQLQDCMSLDGLVLLVDACQAQEGVQGAATRWTDVLAGNRGRVELMVASGTGSAYDGCFTKTLLNTFRSGLSTRGDSLLCSDLLPEISANCRGQAQSFSYSGGSPGSGDPGLWLVPNAARSRDAVRGRPLAGLVDQLTAGLLPTASVRTALLAIEDRGQDRFRLVTGPAGCGKSTLMAALIRPKVVDTLNIRDGYIRAAVFLEPTSTLESVATELAAQLTQTLPRFAAASTAVAADLTDADRTTLSTFDTAVRLPLARCREPGLIIPLIIDGLDQPHPVAAELIGEATRALWADQALDHVRIIATSAGGSATPLPSQRQFPSGDPVEIAAPTAAEICQAVQQQWNLELDETAMATLIGAAPVGGWLTARIAVEILRAGNDLSQVHDLATLITVRVDQALQPDPQLRATILSLVAAAGAGPLLPIQLLCAALAPDGEMTLSAVRDVLVECGALLTRGNPGTPSETVGLAHAAVEPLLTARLESAMPALQAHQRLVEAYERCHAGAAGQPAGAAIETYWVALGPRHYLGSGHPEQAVGLLEALDTARAADNRDRWKGWLPLFTATLGTDDCYTLTARHRLAEWRAESGDLPGAVTEFTELLDDRLRVLGAEHPDTLATRNNLALCRARAGDFLTAIAELEALVGDEQRLLGADHPDTFATRLNLANSRSKAGERTQAIADLQSLLADERRVLGSDREETLLTRQNLVTVRANDGDIPGALTESQSLLADQQRVLGPDHPDTLATRAAVAAWRAQTGDIRSAISELAGLVGDRARVLGPDHPDTLSTRTNLAMWRGKNGDTAGAMADYATLRDDLIRTLGPDHPDTLTARHNFAVWRAKSGDRAGAITDLEALLADRTRIMGAEDRRTKATAAYLTALKTDHR